MNNPDKPLLPLPGLATLLVGALGLAIGWVIWQSGEGRRRQEDLSRLKDALRDPEAPLRERLQSIELWVGDGPDGVPELLRALEHSSPRVRAAATTALARMRPLPADAVRAVLGALDDCEADVRLTALAGIRGWTEHRVLDVQPWVPRLVRLIDDPDPVVAVDAFAIVGHSRADAATAAELTALTKSQRLMARFRAAGLIRSLNISDDAALSAMRRLLDDPDEHVRDEAFETLIASGRFTLEDVLVGLESEDEAVIGLACWALEAFDTQAAIATGRLRELLRSGTGTLSVLHVLAETGTRASDAVPEVLALLTDAEEGSFDISDYNRALIRGGAFRCLTRISTDESLIVATLRQGLLSPNRWTSRYAGQSLREFSPKHARESVPGLIAALAERDDDGKLPVLTALGSLGPDAAEAVPEIAALLDQQHQHNSGPSTSEYANDALRRIRPRSAEAVPALVAALEAELQREDPRTTQLFALYKIGARSEAAERLLIRFVEQELTRLSRDLDGDAPLTQEISNRLHFLTTALLALGRVGQGSEAAHHTICQVLRTFQQTQATTHWNYARVYWALADLRTRPEETVTLLLQAVKPPDIDVENLLTAVSADTPQPPDQRISLAAIRGLGLFPECADRSVLRLAELLQDEDPRVQVAAALALAELGELARPAIPALNALAAAPHAALPASASSPWTLWSESWPDPDHAFLHRLGYVSPRKAARSALERIQGPHSPIAAPRPR